MGKAKILFLFHMHQPYYVDIAEGKAIMPWVRLHGIKGYYDIPYLIDKLKNTKITVNLVPSLIEQINLYSEGKISDLYLDLTLKDPALMSDNEKLFLIDNFFSVNFKNFIEPNSNYKRLFELRGDSDDLDELRKRLSYFTNSDLRDLQALFNLSWFGFAARREFKELKTLFEKQGNYSIEDIRLIVDIQFKVLKRIIPLYRKLLKEGKIEISISPYFHPILPLIIDSDIGKISLPDKPFPPKFSYPEHARMHVTEGIRLFEEVFGEKPYGMWPSEGSVSDDALELISDCGLKWIATDEEILKKSGFGNRHKFEFLYKPYSFRDKLSCFFRDREISDKIGFVYYNFKVDDAVKDFLAHIEKIYNFNKDKGVIVPVIFDGENPWEFYPDLAVNFLFSLFEGIEGSNFAETSTFYQVVESFRGERLESIWPGSWINANFAIWIGHHEMNTAWSYLGRTAAFFEEKSKGFEDEVLLEKAKKELMVAEGSDWFWWYGDDFKVKGQEKFDLLFLKHLSNVYRFLGEEVPVFLKTPIKKPTSLPKPKMPVSLISPDIDGEITNFFEWNGAGEFTPQGKGGAMFEGETPVEKIMFGQDLKNIYFLIALRDKVESIKLFLQDKNFFCLNFPLTQGVFKVPLSISKGRDFENTEFFAKVGVDKVVEIEINGDVFNFEGRDTLKFALSVMGMKETRIPEFGFFETGITFPPFERFLINF
ncbi:glycoside hydrolase, family 57 [Thermotomaculum hydrothermale]|uniref:Glycoside hydrolase, family 57 n=1 Tax=Thermotomaculum hydrothermale TaxID=981385 RepID=A0A7R6SYP5_9BACT|nr:glycoside hydrolase family 57 protein [Thermotomaculum hydrothermale]BBB32999.1 glycoside hydrolase, family 57 [Thermotomaculum hydrothermale]